MTNEHRIILNAIEEALKRDPDLRFGQALLNLDIYGFMNPENPAGSDYKVRDIHADKDSEIIERINKRNEWLELQSKLHLALEKPELKDIGSMTVNERLPVYGLLEDFDKYKKSNKKFARFILQRLDVDPGMIEEILK